MNLILLHGATGIWDEVACLAIPATAILGVALAVLREKPARAEDGDEGDTTTPLADAEDSAEDTVRGRAERGVDDPLVASRAQSEG